MTIASAVVAAVRAAIPGREVYDGRVPKAPDPRGHVVVYCDSGRIDKLQSVGADTDSRQLGWQVSAFGPSREAAGWLAQRVTNYLLDVGIDVDGFAHGEVVHEFTRGPQADDDVQELPTVQAVDQFSCWLSKF